MQTEEKRENIEEKKEERMKMPVSGALERGPGKAPVSGAEISVHDTENGHPSEDVYILAIESSCDETAASVVKNARPRKCVAFWRLALQKREKQNRRIKCRQSY